MTYESDDGIATFDSRAEAQLRADGAMPRRKHNRPYAVASGYHSVRAGHDVWIVMVGNIVMMRSGAMWDYQRKVTVRP